METLRLLSTTQQVDPALFGEEYSDYIDVTEESPFKDYTTLFPKPKGLHFINANTTEVDIQHLKNDCIVPVFSKDNELTVSHPVFIETVYKAAQEFFRNEQIDTPEIIVSHIIKAGFQKPYISPLISYWKRTKRFTMNGWRLLLRFLLFTLILQGTG